MTKWKNSQVLDPSDQSKSSLQLFAGNLGDLTEVTKTTPVVLLPRVCTADSMCETASLTALSYQDHLVQPRCFKIKSDCVTYEQCVSIADKRKFVVGLIPLRPKVTTAAKMHQAFEHFGSDTIMNF